jgi:cysteine synthase
MGTTGTIMGTSTYLKEKIQYQIAVRNQVTAPKFLKLENGQ